MMPPEPEYPPLWMVLLIVIGATVGIAIGMFVAECLTHQL